MKKTNNNKRTRNYATILYPESMNIDSFEILQDTHIPYILSPLHDQDLNADGSPKKPHYHLLLCFDSVKTYDQVLSLVEPLGAVGLEVVNSIKSYARYLCHLDDPDKARYSIESVQSYIIDYNQIISLSSDRYQLIAEMQDWCDSSGCYSFSDLCRYSRVEHQDWFRLLCDSASVIMKAYLQSKSWTQKHRELTGQLPCSDEEPPF